MSTDHSECSFAHTPLQGQDSSSASSPGQQPSDPAQPIVQFSPDWQSGSEVSSSSTHSTSKYEIDTTKSQSALLKRDRISISQLEISVSTKTAALTTPAALDASINKLVYIHSLRPVVHQISTLSSPTDLQCRLKDRIRYIPMECIEYGQLPHLVRTVLIRAMHINPADGFVRDLDEYVHTYQDIPPLDEFISYYCTHDSHLLELVDPSYQLDKINIYDSPEYHMFTQPVKYYQWVCVEWAAKPEFKGELLQRRIKDFLHGLDFELELIPNELRNIHGYEEQLYSITVTPPKSMETYMWIHWCIFLKSTYPQLMMSFLLEGPFNSCVYHNCTCAYGEVWYKKDVRIKFTLHDNMQNAEYFNSAMSQLSASRFPHQLCDEVIPNIKPSSQCFYLDSRSIDEFLSRQGVPITSDPASNLLAMKDIILQNFPFAVYMFDLQFVQPSSRLKKIDWRSIKGGKPTRHSAPKQADTTTRPLTEAERDAKSQRSNAAFQKTMAKKEENKASHTEIAKAPLGDQVKGRRQADDPSSSHKQGGPPTSTSGKKYQGKPRKTDKYPNGPAEEPKAEPVTEPKAVPTVESITDTFIVQIAHMIYPQMNSIILEVPIWWEFSMSGGCLLPSGETLFQPGNLAGKILGMLLDPDQDRSRDLDYWRRFMTVNEAERTYYLRELVQQGYDALNQLQPNPASDPEAVATATPSSEEKSSEEVIPRQ
jgi:hypothetical protein